VEAFLGPSEADQLLTGGGRPDPWPRNGRAAPGGFGCMATSRQGTDRATSCDRI